MELSRTVSGGKPGRQWSEVKEPSMSDLAGQVQHKSLAQMTGEILDLCHAKGWYDQPVSFGEAIALLHSEVSEALEAWRRWGTGDATSTDGKPEGVGSEFADVFIRLLDYCSRFDVDLEAEYERKMAYNRTRPYRHGNRRS
jgi:NTP pyrophosphatase (non-canonical NTP hydrolase)